MRTSIYIIMVFFVIGMVTSCNNRSGTKELYYKEVIVSGGDTSLITLYYNNFRIKKRITYFSDQRKVVQQYDSLLQVILNDVVIDVKTNDTLASDFNYIKDNKILYSMDNSQYSVFSLNKKGNVDTIYSFYEDKRIGYEYRIYDIKSRIIKLGYFNFNNSSNMYSFIFEYNNSFNLPIRTTYIDLTSQDTVVTDNILDKKGLILESTEYVNGIKEVTNSHYWE